VTVIARNDLPQGNVFVSVFREQLFSSATIHLTGRAPLKILFYPGRGRTETAADYYASGMPWQFRSLPHLIAEVLIPLVVVGTIALFLNTLYKFFLPEMHGLFQKILTPQQHRKLLESAERRRARGQPLTPRQERRLRRIVEQSVDQRSDDERARALLEETQGDDLLGEPAAAGESDASAR
jgi:hypothetical protein